MKIKNPKLTITATNGVEVDYTAVEDGCLIQKYSGTGTIETVVLNTIDLLGTGAFSFSAQGCDVSDMVNCTFDQDNGVVLITDPTKDASCTFSLVDDNDY